ASARLRALGLGCCGVLLVAGPILSSGSAERRNLLYAADSGANETPPTLADARAAHAPDIAWLVIGLLAAGGGLGTAVAASRAPYRRASAAGAHCRLTHGPPSPARLHLRSQCAGRQAAACTLMRRTPGIASATRT